MTRDTHAPDPQHDLLPPLPWLPTPNQLSGRARGGRARMQQMSPEERKEFASAAARKRWSQQRVALQKSVGEPRLVVVQVKGNFTPEKVAAVRAAWDAGHTGPEHVSADRAPRWYGVGLAVVLAFVTGMVVTVGIAQIIGG